MLQAARDGRLDTLVLSAADSKCMQVLLDEISSRYKEENIIMLMDGACWHKSGSVKTPENMQLLFLPPYAPELNPIEHIWEELREKYFHNRVFKSLDALIEYLVTSLSKFEGQLQRVKSITAWPWIVSAL